MNDFDAVAQQLKKTNECLDFLKARTQYESPVLRSWLRKRAQKASVRALGLVQKLAEIGVF